VPTASRLRQLRYRIKEFVVRDFSGGPNIRDAASELAANEGMDSWNVSFDERGGVGSRLGYVKRNGLVYPGGLVQNIYYSGLLQSEVVQAGAVLYLGTSTTACKTFTTADRVGFADFGSRLCVIHPVDGVWTSTDGITYTHVTDIHAPLGNCLFPWQNKLFCAGNPTNPARVTWSAAGDPTTWAGTDFNELREKDNEQVVALAGASGVDIQGRQGLLAFKRRSSYRIFNSATGEYSTLDTTVGAASALSVVSIENDTFTLCEKGIFVTNGVAAEQDMGLRWLPLWDASQINYSQLNLCCAGRRGNRAYFSLPRAASTANDLSIELIPSTGSLSPGSNAMSCYTAYGLNTELLLGGSPTVSGQAYQLYSGGTDDGAAIPSRFQTRWFEPSGGFLTQLWQIRLQMRGAFQMAIRKDFATYDFLAQPVTQPAGGILYDSGLHYDTGALYNDPGEQSTVPLFGWGVCRQFSLKISASTSTTWLGDQLFAQGPNTVHGAWALYGLNALYMPLGWA
jgi:hypothetical protein